MKLLIYIISFLIAIWSFKKEKLYQKIIIDTSINNVLEEEANKSFSGIWINVDNQTDSITKCKIRYENNHYVVQMWGACVPSDCDWGERASSQVKKGVKKFKLLWDQKFVESDLTYEILDGNLKLTNSRHFKDNSGRPDFTITEYFIKQK